MAALEVLALNTTVPRIEAPQAGDTYTFPRAADVPLGTAALPAVTFTGDLNTGLFSPTADNIALTTGGTERLRVDAPGNVGVGVTPKNAFTSGGMVTVDVKSASLIGRSLTSWVQLASNIYSDAAGTVKYTATGFASVYQQYLGEHVWFTAPSGTVDVGVTLTERMRLDVSGNLGLGVTPSAWATSLSWRAIQQTGGSLWSAAATDFGLAHNSHYTAGGGWTYTGSAAAARHYMAGATHTWSVAASGTAGTAVTWTDAMRLDASGRLLIGSTSSFSSAAKLQVQDNISLDTNGTGGRFALFSYGVARGFFDCPVASGQLNVAATSILTLMTSATERVYIDSLGNVGLGTATFGTSAAKVFSIGSGSEPSTGPADTVQFFSVDRSAGNTIPGIRCEGTGVTDAAITNVTVTNKIAIKVNGTVYYLLATTSAA
jgi:hypothetical protein